MKSTQNCIVGREVFDKSSGILGKVVREDGHLITMSFPVEGKDVVRSVTSYVFLKKYRLMEPEEKEEKKTRKKIRPLSGEPGTGKKLCKIFLQNLKRMANQDLEIIVSQDEKNVVVKYNGHNIFEMRVCSRRLNVMANKKSLSPMCSRYVVKMYPDSFYWALSAKFVFISNSQIPLMRALISDGLYHKQIIISESNYK